MSTPWQIAPGVERIDVSKGATEVTFTVGNPGPVDDRAVLDIVCSDNAKRSWFTVGEPRRLVPHGGSVTFTVAVAPTDAPPGAYWMAGRVYSADSAPEETAVLSNRVTFDVAAPDGGGGIPLWKWLVPVLAMVAVVVGVVLFLVLRDDDEETVAVPEVRGSSLNSANQVLIQAGLGFSANFANSDTVAAGFVAEQNPAAGTGVPPGSTVTVTVSLGRTSGPETTVTRPPLSFCERFPQICQDATRLPTRGPIILDRPFP